MCVERKIRCDLRVPTCSKCFQAHRRCLGYGLRLSWPRNGDKRRAVVCTPPNDVNREVADRENGRLVFVNVSSWDVGLFYEIFNQGTFGELSQDGSTVHNHRSEISDRQ